MEKTVFGVSLTNGRRKSPMPAGAGGRNVSFGRTKGDAISRGAPSAPSPGPRPHSTRSNACESGLLAPTWSESLGCQTVLALTANGTPSLTTNSVPSAENADSDLQGRSL